MKLEVGCGMGVSYRFHSYDKKKNIVYLHSLSQAKEIIHSSIYFVLNPFQKTQVWSMLEARHCIVCTKDNSATNRIFPFLGHIDTFCRHSTRI